MGRLLGCADGVPVVGVQVGNWEEGALVGAALEGVGHLAVPVEVLATEADNRRRQGLSLNLRC